MTGAASSDRASAADGERVDAALTETIVAVHAASYGTYGARRVHAELRLGQNILVGRMQVARLMRCSGP